MPRLLSPAKVAADGVAAVFCVLVTINSRFGSAKKTNKKQKKPRNVLLCMPSTNRLRVKMHHFHFARVDALVAAAAHRPRIKTRDVAPSLTESCAAPTGATRHTDASPALPLREERGRIFEMDKY